MKRDKDYRKTSRKLLRVPRVPVYRMCANVAPSAEYLQGHGRVAVDLTALRRLWQHSPVLGLVVLAGVPVCAVLRDRLLCNSCGLSAV